MSNKELEFRCTRNAPYDAPGCAGHKNISARQGHYAHTETVMGAVMDMIASFPKEITQGFTIQDVKGGAVYTWDVATGLIEYREEGKHLHQVHRPIYSEFNPAHRINRGKDMEQETAVAKSLKALGTAMDNLVRKTKREHEEKELERRRQERQAALEAEAKNRGEVVLEGWIIARYEFRKNIRFFAPSEVYQKWVDGDPDEKLKAADDIQDIMEDVSDAYSPADEMNGWSNTDYVSVEDIDFKLAEEKNAEA